MTYYERVGMTHIDGSPIFKTELDTRNETEVAAELSRAWQCEMKPFGCLSPVDWFAERAGRVVGIVELKSRTHPATKYPTVFLNLRKWLALQLAAMSFSTTAIFVVRFTDGVRWIPLSDVAVTQLRIGGTTRQVKAISDREPVIEVPILAMRLLKDSP